MNEEIKIDRLERIMEVAKMMHDDLSNRTLLRLARQASDIYATAKEEIEAKEETTTKSSQLPDWCRVGEWVYDSVIRNYVIVKNEVTVGWYIDNIESGRIKQSRPRPFNEKEMLSLLGKVITNGTDAFFLSAYYGETNTVCSGVFMEFDAKSLVDKNFTVDGKPCYKLEHLEKGNWVD